MNAPINSRLTRVIEAHLANSNSRGARAFGFYWTRKSAELATQLIEEFSEPESVILDPFLGSGSTALGSAASTNKRLFVGIELNEMPLENLKLTLRATPDFEAYDFSRFEDALAAIAPLYIFDLNDKVFEVSKVIHSVSESRLRPTSFVGRLGSAKITLSMDNRVEDFREIEKQYVGRIAKFEYRENAYLSPNSRIAVKPGMQVSDVFGPLAFESLSRVRESTNGSMLFRLVIAASLHLCRLTDSKSQSQFPYWYPKQEIHEKSVFEIAKKKLAEIKGQLERGLALGDLELVSSFSSWQGNPRHAALLLRGDTTKILPNAIPANSVDLVITDPPYFDQVAYSEYLKLWEFFTGFEADLENEIVESSRVGADKSRKQFLEDLSAAFLQVRKCMKAGSVALIYFKDSKPQNLHDFIFCLERAGLVYESQTHLAKSSFTYKQNASQENTVGGDAIMIFTAGKTGVAIEPVMKATMEELDQMFLRLLEEYIISNGPSSLTSALDNRLISALYPTGYLSRIKSANYFSKLASARFAFDPGTRTWSLFK